MPCSHYGLKRHELYKGYYLCNNCDLWDAEVSAGNTRCKQTSKQFQCQAKHTSFLMPTQEHDAMSSYRYWSSSKKTAKKPKKKEAPKPKRAARVGITTLLQQRIDILEAENKGLSIENAQLKEKMTGAGGPKLHAAAAAGGVCPRASGVQQQAFAYRQPVAQTNAFSGAYYVYGASAAYQPAPNVQPNMAYAYQPYGMLPQQQNNNNNNKRMEFYFSSHAPMQAPRRPHSLGEADR